MALKVDVFKLGKKFLDQLHVGFCFPIVDGPCPRDAKNHPIGGMGNGIILSEIFKDLFSNFGIGHPPNGIGLETENFKTERGPSGRRHLLVELFLLEGSEE